MQSNFDKGLLDYFTDVEHLRDLFKEYVAAPTFQKRIFAIHGVGGVGKSSLLRMFCLHCKSLKVPVALASGDETESALYVLARWAEDLKTDGVKFSNFVKTFEHYRAIQVKVDEQVRKTQRASGRVVDIAGKTASKTADAAGGALAGALIGSIIPGIGTAIGGVLGGMGAEALVDWLRGADLSKSDIDLLLDSAKKLTDDFLDDVAKAADKQRIVLMLDTLEQMTALDDWVCNVAQRLHTNALLVIAGRALPNWSLAWQSWLAHTQVEELKPMTEDVMRDLVQRYYATMRGGEPNPAQVEAIIHFARGLPMVVTSAVQLWVEYGVEDFQAIKPEIVANLVDRLMEGVPSELVPVLEAAAVVRWFDQPILRAVTGLADVRDVYNELRRFPFVRTRAEGLALHDAVREFMDENLRVQDSERHNELHTRAAVYFGSWLLRLNAIPGLSEEWQRLTLEKSYHLILSNETAGIDFLHSSFGQGLTYFRYQFCRRLINDSESLNLSEKRTLHLVRFNRIRLTIAEFSPAYVTKKDFDQVVAQSDLDPMTKWQVLLSYAGFLGFTTAQPELESEYCRRSLDALKAIGQEESGVGCLVLKAVARWYYDEPSKSEALFMRALRISDNIREPFFAYEPYIELGHLRLLQSRYSDAEQMWRAAIKIGESFQNDSMIANALNHLAHALMAQGRLLETEQVLVSAMEAAKRLPDTLGAGRDKEMYIKRHFGMLYQMRGEYDKSIRYYSESAQIYRERKSIGGRSRTLVLLAGCLYEAGLRERAESLRSEIEELIPKAGSREVIAAWLTIQGHLAIDDAIKGNSLLNDGIARYEEALTIALEGFIPVVDEIVNRIFCKLAVVDRSEKREFVPAILNTLISFCSKETKGDKCLRDVEIEKRQRFAGSQTKAEPDSLILSQLKSALLKGVPERRPSPWWAY